MAESPTPTASTETTTSQPNNDPDPLVGTNFVADGTSYTVVKFLRHDNHADVYSATAAGHEEELEARAYTLANISTKLRHYRQRNLDRLSSRQVLRVKSHGKDVVFYKTGPLSAPSPVAAPQTETSGPPRRDSGNRQGRRTETRRKTEYQRESARVRQLERRKSKRLANRLQGRADKEEAGSEQSHLDDAMGEDGEWTAWDEAMILVLYFAYEHNPKWREELLPTAHAHLLKKYRDTKFFTFDSDQELGEFVKLKQREIILLKRLSKKLPEREQIRKEEFREQLRGVASTNSFAGPSELVKMAKNACLVIRQVGNLMPEIIKLAESTHRQLKERLEVAIKLGRDIENTKSRREGVAKLNRDASMKATLSYSLAPASALFRETLSQAEEAQEQARQFTESDRELAKWLGEREKQYKESLTNVPVK